MLGKGIMSHSRLFLVSRVIVWPFEVDCISYFSVIMPMTAPTDVEFVIALKVLAIQTSDAKLCLK